MKKSEHHDEILEKAKRVDDPEWETSWNESGELQQKKVSKITEGKKSKKAGTDFELKVRKDLEEKGWTVAKWPNNLDLETKKIIPAKRIFNPFRKVMTIGTGFPDFIAFQLVGEKIYNVIGVECKINGILSKEEKEKCAFLLQNKIFNEIWIASKTLSKNPNSADERNAFCEKEKEENLKGKINYESFREEYGKKFGME